MMYAHLSNPIPRALPGQWKSADGLVMGLALLSDADLAALGWYPVRYETLEPGSTGYGEMYLDGEAGEYVVPALQPDPATLDALRLSKTVTALQGMLAIQSAGLAAGFNAWKSTLDPVVDFATIAFFEKAQTWKRDNEYLIQGATALGLTDAQLDGLFDLAETL